MWFQGESRLARVRWGRRKKKRVERRTKRWAEEEKE
jgi:hypothetical protein